MENSNLYTAEKSIVFSKMLTSNSLVTKQQFNSSYRIKTKLSRLRKRRRIIYLLLLIDFNNNK